MSELSRRKFFLGAAATIITAPAAVRALPILLETPIELGTLLPNKLPPMSIYAELTAITRRAFVPRLQIQLYAASPVLSLLNDLEDEKKCLNL